LRKSPESLLWWYHTDNKLSEPYHDDIFMILESYLCQYLMLCWYQVIPKHTRFVRYW
jgi:hypothetical protein